MADRKRPWWLVRRSAGYALFLSIFYPALGLFWLAFGAVESDWMPIALGLLCLVLSVAAWASVRWYRHSRERPATPGDERSTLLDRDDG